MSAAGVVLNPGRTTVIGRDGGLDAARQSRSILDLAMEENALLAQL
jgi:hypothetical protein